MNPEHEWAPTRIPGHRRTGRGGLTPEQQALAEDLHVRALALRAASEDGLSIREAVDLAAFQLGMSAPTVDVLEAPDED